MSLFGHFPVGCAQFLLTIHLLYTIKKWHRGPLIDRFLLIKWINIIRYIYMYILCVNIIISISMERLRLTPFLFLKSLLWLCFYCCPKTYQWATLLHRLPCFFITMNTHIVSYIVLLHSLKHWMCIHLQLKIVASKKITLFGKNYTVQGNYWALFLTLRKI